MARGSARERAPRRAPGARLLLREGRDKPLRQRHPWIFSGAVDSIGDDLHDGDIGEIASAQGEVLAIGYVNRRSQIVARVLSFDGRVRIDDAFFEARIARAVAARPKRAAARLVHAESDGLPGLVVDRYGDFCVLTASTLGIDRQKHPIVRALLSVENPRGIWERSDVEGREKEGLAPETGLLAGTEPPELLEVPERTHDGGEVTLLVDVRRGHKTGAYLDQADNRRLVASYASGAEVLNLFSYTGAFSLHAARAGAEVVTNVDSSADALSLSERAAALNGLLPRIVHERADAFAALRAYRDRGRTFDVVIVDPPKFAHSMGQLDRAARAYKDLFRVAFQVTRAGGFAAVFSCSGLVSLDLFQKIVWSASLEARRDVQVVSRLGQATDHPLLLSFPEGEYLKGLLCRVG